MAKQEEVLGKRKRRSPEEIAADKAAKEAAAMAKREAAAARKAEAERQKAERKKNAELQKAKKAEEKKALMEPAKAKAEARKATTAAMKAKAKAKAALTKAKAKAQDKTVVATGTRGVKRLATEEAPQPFNNPGAKAKAATRAEAKAMETADGSPQAAKRRLPGPTTPQKRQRLNKEELDNYQLVGQSPASSTGAISAVLGPSAVMQKKAQFIAHEVGLPTKDVAGAVRLFEAGNTLPFIARYRKEQTGSLNEEKLRKVERAMKRVEELETRRAAIGHSLSSLGKLDETKSQLQAATSIEELEDIYAPHKCKRRTRAQAAEDLGLRPLADLIDKGGSDQSPQAAARRLTMQLAALNPTSEKIPREDALAGARDIVASKRSQSATMRAHAREFLRESVQLVAAIRSPEADPEGKYKCYWTFKAPLSRVWSHQFLAIQRGEKEKVLTVRFDCNPQAEAAVIDAEVPAGTGNDAWAAELRQAVEDGLHRLLRPTIEREWRRMLKEQAEDEAFDTYRRNVKAKLLTPPCLAREALGPIIGLDPGFRHGCKIAAISATGAVLETLTIYPVPKTGSGPGPIQDAARRNLAALVKKLKPALLAIGNGTASTETEAFTRKVLLETASNAQYTIVDECGASIYSASELAAAELPDMDVTLRGAVSIARRSLDPLAELVKIDPQSLGVGMYQHDCEEKRLKAELSGAVEECVNAVGVDVNTASPSLLQHVAGIGAKLSQAIVSHRNTEGAFSIRQDLKRVKGLGAVSFQQAAGFLRINGGKQDLDATAIHPESYSIAQKLQQRFGAKLEALQNASLKETHETLAAEMGCGVATLADIIANLTSMPSADPRASQPKPLVKQAAGDHNACNGEDGVDAQAQGLAVHHLKAGMILRGVVRNVVQFGAFLDIGVHHDALLHYSCYPRPLPHPEWPSVNDRFAVEVKSAPEQRGSKWRISLTLPTGK